MPDEVKSYFLIARDAPGNQSHTYCHDCGAPFEPGDRVTMVITERNPNDDGSVEVIAQMVHERC